MEVDLTGYQYETDICFVFFVLFIIILMWLNMTAILKEYEQVTNLHCCYEMYNKAVSQFVYSYKTLLGQNSLLAATLVRMN